MELKNILPALVAAKQAFEPIKKDKRGNYNAYASLDAILAATEPALLANGLIISQSVVDQNLVTSLYHVSGESLSSCLKLPEINDPQKLGSAITYYRRYSVAALLSVCADEDDDGQSAVDRTKKADTTAKPQPASPLALVRDDTAVIAKLRLGMGEYFGELGWTTEQRKAWAKSIDNRPSDKWPLAIWESAIGSLQSAVDQQVLLVDQ